MVREGTSAFVGNVGLKDTNLLSVQNGTMIQGVETNQGERVDKPTVNVGNGVTKETCSVEKGWWIGSVTKQGPGDRVPKDQRH
eukprot:7661218-Karenia_brevis.AAC.1